MREKILEEFLNLIQEAVPHGVVATVASTEEARPVIFCTVSRESYSKTITHPFRHYAVSSSVAISILRTEEDEGLKDLESCIDKITRKIDASPFLENHLNNSLKSVEMDFDHRSDTLIFSATLNYELNYERVLH